MAREASILAFLLAETVSLFRVAGQNINRSVKLVDQPVLASPLGCPLNFSGLGTIAHQVIEPFNAILGLPLSARVAQVSFVVIWTLVLLLPFVKVPQLNLVVLAERSVLRVAVSLKTQPRSIGITVVETHDL